MLRTKSGRATLILCRTTKFYQEIVKSKKEEGNRLGEPSNTNGSRVAEILGFVGRRCDPEHQEDPRTNYLRALLWQQQLARNRSEGESCSYHWIPSTIHQCHSHHPKSRNLYRLANSPITRSSWKLSEIDSTRYSKGFVWADRSTRARRNGSSERFFKEVKIVEDELKFKNQQVYHSTLSRKWSDGKREFWVL